MRTRSVLWSALRSLLWLAVVLAALAHATGIAPLRFVDELDRGIADTRLRALMPGTLDPRVVIVDIDEKSLSELGRWPWGRDRVASLVTELLDRQRAAVIGFDMLFAEPDDGAGLPELERLAQHDAALAADMPRLRSALDHDARLAQALQGRPAVLGYYLSNGRDGRRVGVLPESVMQAADLHGRPIAFTRWDGYAANLAILARAAPVAGYFNNVPDPDGLVRSVPLLSQIDDRYGEALSLAMFRVYTGRPAVVPALPQGRWLPRSYDALTAVWLRQGNQQQAIPVDANVHVRVPFRGPGGPHGGSFEYVSASDLLARRVPPGHLAGKLVLIGTSAPGVYDQRATPVAAVYPGVEVHANLISGLLDDRIPVQPDWSSAYEVLQLLALAAVLTLLLPRLRALQAAQAVLALVVLLVALNVWAYHVHGLLLPLAASLLLTLGVYLGVTTWGYIVEGRSRRSLARLFGTYVPPELVTEMARDPARYDMRAENRELTIMFCDMRNFTSVSELLTPDELRGLVNGFFTAMTAAIRSHRGTLDKYIGDAIMAFWGAPLDDPAHAEHAVRAALGMIEQLGPLNIDLRRRGLPEIGVGIGLNTGLVCVGDMGSNIRRSYTVMGDAVNLASRIEGLTRHYGVDLLVGESTRQGADGGEWHWVEVDRVRVKGKQQSVTLFTPVARPQDNPALVERELRLWQLALTAYRLQHWDDAQASLLELRNGFAESPRVGLYRQLGERIEHDRMVPPPANWDGARTFDSK